MVRKAAPIALALLAAALVDVSRASVSNCEVERLIGKVHETASQIGAIFDELDKDDRLLILRRRVMHAVSGIVAIVPKPKNARKLSVCYDFPNWMDRYGTGCEVFEGYEPCGGFAKWDSSWMGKLRDQTDFEGNSPKDACCACGGGDAGTGTPTASPTAFPTIEYFDLIAEQLKKAPNDGSKTEIVVDQPYIAWKNTITIEPGQDIRIVGRLSPESGRPIFDGRNNTNHFFIYEGATFSATNIEFISGTSAIGGSIQCYGVLAVLRNCIFRGNIAYEYGGAVAIGTPYLELKRKNARLEEITNSRFERNGAGTAGGALLIANTILSSPVSITNTSFIANNLPAATPMLSSGGSISIFSVSGEAIAFKTCTFKGNEAKQGGGIRITDSTLSNISI